MMSLTCEICKNKHKHMQMNLFPKQKLHRLQARKLTVTKEDGRLGIGNILEVCDLPHCM